MGLWRGFDGCVRPRGATAVQVAESVNGKRRIIAHVGSAHSEAELGLLIERAQELLADPGQGVFDLGVEPVAPAAALVRSAGPEGLFADPDTGTAARKGKAMAPRVVGTSSQVLYQLLA